MKITRLTAILMALLPLCATAQKSTMTVTLANAPEGSRLVVCEPQGGRLQPIDTLSADKKGRYHIERRSEEPQFLVLALTTQPNTLVHVIMQPREKATLALGFRHDIGQMTVEDVKGSADMEVYRQYSALMAGAMTDPQRQASMPDSMQALLSRNPDVLMSAFLVTYFEQAFEQYAPLYKQIRDALLGRYPNNSFVRHLDDKLRGAVVAGMEAPDIAMADRNGNIRRLSDLRGKVVLIDFWASWCAPCRRENPNVVRLYKKYKDKGFEIFSVSLDNSREKWLQAIEKDGLEWENHVSDLRGWNSAGGRLYGVTSIPATVLVDKDGTVLARNLRGAELENKLKEILGQ